jgi:hypothetical protein
MLDGSIRVSYTPKPSMDACHVDGQKFNTELQAMTDDQIKGLGVKQITAWCDDTIILKITGKGGIIT